MSAPMVCIEGLPGSGKSSVCEALAADLGVQCLQQDRGAWAPALAMQSAEGKLLAQVFILSWYRAQLDAVHTHSKGSVVVVESSPRATAAYADFHAERNANVDAMRPHVLPVAEHPFALTLFLKCSPEVAAGRVQKRAVAGDDAWSLDALCRLNGHLEHYIDSLAVRGHPVVTVCADADADTVARACASLLTTGLNL